MIPKFDKQLSDNGIAYTRCGRGPVLLLIHGVGLRAESWHPLVASLLEDFELIVIDLPGHGASRALNENFTTVNFHHYYSEIIEFINSISLNEFTVCGHSLGALLAIELASDQLTNVVGLAALSSVYQRSNNATVAVKSRAAKLSNSAAVTGVTQTIERWFTNSPAADMLPHAKACEYWLRNNSVEGYAMAYKSFADRRGPSPATLARIECSSSFMTGGLDLNSTPEMSRRLCAETKKAVVSVVPGAGHMMPLTHTAAVADAVLELNQARPENRAGLDA